MGINNKKKINRLKKVSLVAVNNQKGKISEQYRIIRTNFLTSIDCKNSQTLTITSPNQEEGKSTTAANFAISLAQQGKKVLLVDADLRNSSMHYIFKVDNSFGLSSLLVGERELEYIINKTEINGLDFLPSGPVPNNPAELLGSKKMELFINTVIRQYDIVLFDTPAVLEVADAKIIANLCDGILLVIRWGKTKSNEAKDAKKLLESASAKLLGVILNSKE
ncbi:CpsD/CapB family tyrosine-protein kinase [Neobacillus niacini]|uniref:CpsD/CapB family tyrosine-protein kinase n=1 Tax=Neobacillus niacini TaxID=86668 RepID=UPI002FFF839E